LGLPLSRFSVADVAQQARQSGLAATISDSTVWRWLDADAIRPWQHRCWIFPRDPQFAVKAGRILDLYQRRWQGICCATTSSCCPRAWSRSCELGGSNPAPYPIEPLKAAQVERLAGLIRHEGLFCPVIHASCQRRASFPWR